MESWWDRIYVGDCVELLRGWPADRPIDLVFADPPYNIGYSYDLYDDSRPDDEYLDWLRQWIGACAAVLAPHGSLWIAIGDEYAAEVKWIAQREVGLHLRSWVVWYYTFGVHCTRKFTRSHTHLLYFVRDPSNFVFNSEAIRVPSARRMVYRDRRADPRGRVPDNTWILRPHDAWWAFHPEEDTWYFSRVAGTFRERAGFHGCQLPERLVARVILACTNPGDVVLDPFLGSGTTAVVAKKLGRRWVGIELSPEYARHAEKRIEAVRVGDPLVGPDDPIMSVKRRTAATAGRTLDFDGALVSSVALDVAGRLGCELWQLLTDPACNVEFVDACHAQGLRGRPVDWNHAVLRQVLARDKRPDIVGDPEFPGEPSFHACDMAASRVLHQGYPDLATVLCDHRCLLLYEACVRELSLGMKTAEMRRELLRLVWLAAHREELTSDDRGCGPITKASVPLERGHADTVPDAPGLFELVATERKGASYRVYCGWTRSLRESWTFWLDRKGTVEGYLPRPASLEFWWAGAGRSSKILARQAFARLLATPTAFSSFV